MVMLFKQKMWRTTLFINTNSITIRIKIIIEIASYDDNFN